MSTPRHLEIENQFSGIYSENWIQIMQQYSQQYGIVITFPRRTNVSHEIPKGHRYLTATFPPSPDGTHHFFNAVYAELGIKTHK